MKSLGKKNHSTKSNISSVSWKAGSLEQNRKSSRGIMSVEANDDRRKPGQRPRGFNQGDWLGRQLGTGWMWDVLLPRLILYTHRGWMWVSLLKGHPLFFIGVPEIAGVLLSNFLTQQSISKQLRLGFLPWTIWTKSVYMVALIECLLLSHFFY